MYDVTQLVASFGLELLCDFPWREYPALCQNRPHGLFQYCTAHQQYVC
jgi:hypothetical protein